MPRNTKNDPNFIHVVQHDITAPSALILGRVRSKEWAGGAQLVSLPLPRSFVLL